MPPCSLDDDRHPIPTPDGRGGRQRDAAVVDLPFGPSVQERVQGDTALEPRQVRAGRLPSPSQDGSQDEIGQFVNRRVLRRDRIHELDAERRPGDEVGQE